MGGKSGYSPSVIFFFKQKTAYEIVMLLVQTCALPILVNYNQLRHYIFLKYQILTSNKEQWKAKYNQKVQTEKEVTFTDLGNIKNLVSDVKKTGSSTIEGEENVPEIGRASLGKE